MADLDVTEVLDNPDLVEFQNLSYVRNPVVTGEDGIGAIVGATPAPFFGVITNLDGDRLVRSGVGEHQEGSITVHTRTALIDGEDDKTADIVVWKGTRYTVRRVNDYSHFGPGFIAAECDLFPLKGKG